MAPSHLLSRVVRRVSSPGVESGPQNREFGVYLRVVMTLLWYFEIEIFRRARSPLSVQNFLDNLLT